jgi:hypothetical protein
MRRGGQRTAASDCHAGGLGRLRPGAAHCCVGAAVVGVEDGTAVVGAAVGEDVSRSPGAVGDGVMGVDVGFGVGDGVGAGVGALLGLAVGAVVVGVEDGTAVVGLRVGAMFEGAVVGAAAQTRKPEPCRKV